MKLIKLYESILLEGAAESCVAEFGKLLFGDQLGGSEKNTNIENNHATALYDFTDVDYGPNIKPEVVGAVEHLQTCINTFPEILKPETERVYRGTNIPIMYFIKNGAIPTANISQPYEYKATSKIQSWSDRVSIAKVFGNGDDMKKLSSSINIDNINLGDLIPMLSKIKIPVVLEYVATEKDFLFKSKYLKKLSEFENEDEVLRIENTPIVVNAYLNDKWLSQSSRLLINKINESL